MGIWKGIFDGIKAERKGKISRHYYDNLTYTPFLYDTPHLFHLYDKAGKEGFEEKQMIHDYLHGKFEMPRNVSHIGDYAALTEFIEKDLKIGSHEKQIPKSHMTKEKIYLDEFKGDW